MSFCVLLLCFVFKQCRASSSAFDANSWKWTELDNVKMPRRGETDGFETIENTVPFIDSSSFEFDDPPEIAYFVRLDGGERHENSNVIHERGIYSTLFEKIKK